MQTEVLFPTVSIICQRAANKTKYNFKKVFLCCEKIQYEVFELPNTDNKIPPSLITANTQCMILFIKAATFFFFPLGATPTF